MVQAFGVWARCLRFRVVFQLGECTTSPCTSCLEREFFIDNLLVRFHCTSCVPRDGRISSGFISSRRKLFRHEIRDNRRMGWGEGFHQHLDKVARLINLHSPPPTRLLRAPRLPPASGVGSGGAATPLHQDVDRVPCRARIHCLVQGVFTGVPRS